MNAELIRAAVSDRARKHVQVLVVDDEAAVRRALARMLGRYGFEVREADCGDSALQALQRPPAISVVLLDQSMPNGSGSSFVARMRQLTPSARIILHTAQLVPSEERALVDDLIHKPADVSALVALIDRWSARASSEQPGLSAS
jgi:CheY-like chemotaxis protein